MSRGFVFKKTTATAQTQIKITTSKLQKHQPLAPQAKSIALVVQSVVCDRYVLNQDITDVLRKSQELAILTR